MKTDIELFYETLGALHLYLPERIRLDADGDIMAVYNGVAEAVHTHEGGAMLTATLVQAAVEKKLRLEVGHSRVVKPLPNDPLGEVEVVPCTRVGVSGELRQHGRTVADALAKAMLEHLRAKK